MREEFGICIKIISMGRSDESHVPEKAEEEKEKSITFTIGQ
jgi:hypothetical protein